MAKVGFVTCVQLGLSCMETIYRVGGSLDVIITLHDHLARGKSGRVYLDSFCTQHGIDLVKIKNVNEAIVLEQVQARDLDWLMIIGWSQIARAELLAAPRYGVLGVHPTLLPEGRGRAAIPWAILKGLERTGVTLFRLDAGVDTGDIVAQQVLEIAADETATTLYERVRRAHESLMEGVWPDLVARTIQLTPQDETRATEWPGRTPEDGRITPSMDCGAVDRLVRATTRPYPGAFWLEGERLYRIWAGRAVTGRQLINSACEANQLLSLPLQDGTYEATDWEIEAASVPT